MSATKKNPEASRKPRPSKSRRTAEFPAAAPPPPLFTPKPLDQGDIRRNARVRLQDGRVGKVVATGAHRVRIQPDEGASCVVFRAQVAAMVAAAPEPKRSYAKRPKSLRIAGDAPVGQIANALVEWADRLAARDRVVAALKDALARLEA